MKKLILHLLFVLSTCAALAQSPPNPYKAIGKDAPKMATLTNAEYEEFFNKDSLVQIGSTIMNRYTGEVAFFAEDDAEKFKQFKEHNEKNFRFLSIDPLSLDYPELSPYQFAGNTPIQAADLDGLEPDFKFEGGETNDGYFGRWDASMAKVEGKTYAEVHRRNQIQNAKAAAASAVVVFGCYGISALGGTSFAVGGIRVVIAPAVTGGVVNSAIAVMKGESGAKVATSFAAGFISGAVLGTGASSTFFEKAATGGFAGVIGEYSQQILDNQTGVSQKSEIDFLKIAEAGGLGSLASTTADALKDKVSKYIEQTVSKEISRLLSDKNVKALVKEVRIANPGMSNKDIVKYATNQLTQAAQLATESGVNLKVAMFEAIDKSMDVINSKVQDKVEQLKKKNE